MNILKWKIKKQGGDYVRFYTEQPPSKNNPIVYYSSRQAAHKKAKWLNLEDYTVEVEEITPKIESWRVICETEGGDKIELEDVPEEAAAMIDEAIKEQNPVAWGQG